MYTHTVPKQPRRLRRCPYTSSSLATRWWAVPSLITLQVAPLVARPHRCPQQLRLLERYDHVYEAACSPCVPILYLLTLHTTCHNTPDANLVSTQDLDVGGYPCRCRVRDVPYVSISCGSRVITGALSLACREVESQRQLFSKIPFLRNLSVAAQRAKEEQKQNEDEDHADNKGCVTRAGRLRYR